MTNTVGVIGLGLIGGSFALSCKNTGMRVIGADPDSAARELAKQVLDEVYENPKQVCQADEIFIAAPVGAFGEIFRAIAPALSDRSVVFDGGSCKREAAAQAAQHLGAKARRFVPCHPVAGGEDSGFAAANAELFAGKWTVVCPDNCDADAVDAVARAWQRTGATVAHMNAQEHDVVFAAISHLPHVLSFSLMEMLRDDPGGEEMLQYAAGGFRDFTRIAGSHPVMWRDICLQNSDELLNACARFRKQLEMVELAIGNQDGAALKEKFAAAREVRRRWREKVEQ